MRGVLVALLVGVAGVASACGGAVCVGGCSRGASLQDGGSAKGTDASADAASASADPVREDLWTRAKLGDAADLARLADREGESGLVERGATGDPATRLTAIRAMAFAPDPGAFGGLPFLAEAARGTDEPQAQAALDSAIDLAARPRRAVDPEDAAEMKAGCDGLLALAKDPKASRGRRVKAIGALRMLVDRGCVDPAAIPTDLDAH